jgi:hypothetical protein
MLKKMRPYVLGTAVAVSFALFALHAASASPLRVTDVSPDTAFGAPLASENSGGRIHSLAIDPFNNSTIYGVSSGPAEPG